MLNRFKVKSCLTFEERKIKSNTSMSMFMFHETIKHFYCFSENVKFTKIFRQ